VLWYWQVIGVVTLSVYISSTTSHGCCKSREAKWGGAAGSSEAAAAVHGAAGETPLQRVRGGRCVHAQPAQGKNEGATCPCQTCPRYVQGGCRVYA